MNQKTITRDELLFFEAAAAIFCLDLLLLLTLFRHSTPVTLDSSFIGTVHAPWIFAAVQLLLHYFSPLAAGLFFPLLTAAFMLLFPFLEQKALFNKTAKLIFILLIVIMALLTIAGSLLF